MGRDRSAPYAESMEQLLAFVVPMLVLAAITVGWLTDALSPGRGYGLRLDMGIGLVGCAVVATVLYALSRLGAGGLTATFIMGLVGAALAIGIQRVFWRAPALAK